MNKFAAAAVLVLIALPAMAGKRTDDATIRDIQPFHSAAAKKFQQYEFSLQTLNDSYQCRTSGDHSTNASDFPVGSAVTLIVNGKEAEIKTPTHKSAKCTITHVEPLP